MKKITITGSSAWEGYIEVIYNDSDSIIKFDFMGAELNNQQKDLFMRRCPVTYSTGCISKAFPHSNLKVIEGDYFVTFNDFWQEYNLKRNRLRCEKLWNKMSNADKVLAHFGIRAYRRHLQLNTWKNQADPETYLKSRYWENEWKN